MKGFNILLMIITMVLSCKGQTSTEKTAVQEVAYLSFGEKIEANEAQDPENMKATYIAMKEADTLKTKFTAKVKKVCKAKGCWMKLDLENGEEAMVRFKDYGFFMPLDIEGKEVVVNGLAFVESMSVEDQKHYAEDAGASAEELAKITSPKRTYGFEADGVLVSE